MHEHARPDLLPTHRKLRFSRGEGRLEVYASLYRLGDPGPAPALIYIGGAAARDDYIARIETEPERIRVEIEKALETHRPPRLDVIVCPCPQDTRLPGEDESAGLSWFDDHWLREILPVLGADPTAIGLVGHSAGAACVVHLGIVLEACAVATLGGVGIVQAAHGKELGALLQHLGASGWGLGAGGAWTSRCTGTRAIK